MRKKLKIYIVLLLIFIITILVNIPLTVDGQIYASIVNNLPIIGWIFTAFDIMSINKILSSNITGVGQILKLSTHVASVIISLLVAEKTSVINDYIDTLDIDRENRKTYKILSGIIIYFFFAVAINSLILNTFLHPFIYAIGEKADQISNMLNQINNSLK